MTAWFLMSCSPGAKSFAPSDPAESATGATVFLKGSSRASPTGSNAKWAVTGAGHRPLKGVEYRTLSQLTLTIVTLQAQQGS